VLVEERYNTQKYSTQTLTVIVEVRNAKTHKSRTDCF